MDHLKWSSTFNALGDKTRLHLYQILAEKSEICVSELAKQLNITPACVSQHMKVLAEAGLVKRLREGQRVCYEISSDTVSKRALNKLIFKD